jgi:hypothetical protein
MRRFGAVLALVLLCGAVFAPSAPAHKLLKFQARDLSNTLMKRICHDDPRPCRGWAIQQCARRSSHRVDCRAAHFFRENGIDKVCRMWVTNQLSGNIIRAHVLRATVNCRPV